MKNEILLWPALVSACVTTALGFLWFMIIFRKAYIVGLGRTQEQLEKGPSLAVASFMQLVGNLVMALILAWLMNTTGEHTLAQAVKLGFLLWTGFVAAVIGPMYAFQAFSFVFFLITTGYVLVSVLITALITGSWSKLFG